jgi:hypothetical protein
MVLPPSWVDWPIGEKDGEPRSAGGVLDVRREEAEAKGEPDILEMGLEDHVGWNNNMLQSKIYAHIGKSAMETYIFAVDIVLVGDGCERHDLVGGEEAILDGRGHEVMVVVVAVLVSFRALGGVVVVMVAVAVAVTFAALRDGIVVLLFTRIFYHAY